MYELPEIVPRRWPVAKEPRCAEGPSVKTMLCDGLLEVRKGIAADQQADCPATPGLTCDKPAIAECHHHFVNSRRRRAKVPLHV